MSGDFERALALAERLLEACTAAACGPGSDALSALHAPLRQALAGLARSVPDTIDDTTRDRLKWLGARSATLAGFMLRRQNQAAQALQALSAGSPRLRAMTRDALYGAGAEMRWGRGR